MSNTKHDSESVGAESSDAAVVDENAERHECPGCGVKWDCKRHMCLTPRLWPCVNCWEEFSQCRY
jgi:hypothetical protein